MNRRIILGSGSPRRREILGSAGYEFEVITSDADENIGICDPEEMVKELSRRKATAVYESLDSNTGILVIGADTLVFMDGKPMGKPADENEEVEFLKKMAGTSHDVITGVSVIYDEGDEVKSHSFAAITKVKVANLSEDEIKWYLATNEWTDKAGGYAIQGFFGKFISGIEGEYNNVVGFPLASFYREISALNIL